MRPARARSRMQAEDSPSSCLVGGPAQRENGQSWEETLRSAGGQSNRQRASSGRPDGEGDPGHSPREWPVETRRPVRRQAAWGQTGLRLIAQQNPRTRPWRPEDAGFSPDSQPAF